LQSLDHTPAGSRGPCRVLIADDSRLVRATVSRLLLAELKTLMICGEAHDGNDAIAKIKSLRPDIVLLDLSLPAVNGLEVVRSLQSEDGTHHSTFVLMSEQELPVLKSIAALAGVEFCVPKMSIGTDIVPLLKTIAQRRACSVV
jgi:two-component system, NarL family, response regulator NreC